tara:strand:- start:1268 stop:2749 length:1482 start_codon:yes stop_codon:yes gene_type:complete
VKWIGQHIWDFISRFRSDVYLEKVTNPGAGSYKHLVLDNNSKVRFRTSAETVSDLGITGDITSVTVTTDSGASNRHTVNSGPANFSFLGSSGVDVTNSTNTVTIQAVASEIDHDSLSNFVANEHIDWTGSSAGTIHSTNIPTLNQNTTGTAAGLSSTLPVSSGGTGQTTLSSNSVLTGDGTNGIVAESNLTYNGANLELSSSDISAPDLTLTSTSNHASGSNFIFIKDRDVTSGPKQVDGDVIGTISFRGEDDAGLVNTYGSIVGKVAESSAGQEGGELSLKISSHDGELVKGLTLLDGDAEDEIDVTIASGINSLTSVAGNLNVGGLITGKQRQVYSQSFFDDLGTTKHYIPWKSVNEQTTIYQEESAMVMPCDGRIVSVSVRVQFPNANGDITIGVHTCPVNVSTFVNNFTNNWIEEETELLPLAGTDDNHLFHFTFDNAKHFESSELCAISIQCSQDVTPSLAYWHVSTVVEYDWSTFLGTTSAEIESTP